MSNSTSPIVLHPELSLSSLSISSSFSSHTRSEDLDWDRSQSDIDVGGLPCTPPRASHIKALLQEENESTPGSASKNGRSLSELLSLHTEKDKNGQDIPICLTATEEQVLEEELRNWINSDCSPYELDSRRHNGHGFDRMTLFRSLSSGARRRSDTITAMGNAPSSNTTAQP